MRLTNSNSGSSLGLRTFSFSFYRANGDTSTEHILNHSLNTIMLDCWLIHDGLDALGLAARLPYPRDSWDLMVVTASQAKLIVRSNVANSISGTWYGKLIAMD